MSLKSFLKKHGFGSYPDQGKVLDIFQSIVIHNTTYIRKYFIVYFYDLFAFSPPLYFLVCLE